MFNILTGIIHYRGIYEGEFNDGMKQGRGRYTYPDGGVYEGEYKDDNEHGQGRETFPDLSVCWGDFSDGNQHGKGRITLPDAWVCLRGRMVNRMDRDFLTSVRENETMLQLQK